MRDRDLALTDGELSLIEEAECARPSYDGGKRFATFPAALCAHSQWSWKAWGRRCPSCGTFVVDFGD